MKNNNILNYEIENGVFSNVTVADLAKEIADNSNFNFWDAVKFVISDVMQHWDAASIYYFAMKQSRKEANFVY